VSRIKNILGKAVLHFDPTGAPLDPPSQADVFDSILGTVNMVRTSETSKSKPASINMRVRLEYDDKIISTDAAAAYLARFQHHLEFPDQLVL
jgi:hypothetical protein